MAAWIQWVIKGVGLAALFLVSGAGASWEKFRRLRLRIRDLALLIDAGRPALGSLLRIQVAADLAGGVEVRRWDLALICGEIDRRMQGIGLQIAPAAIFERRAGGRKPRRFDAGRQAILSWQVEVPGDLPPSSPIHRPEFPLHDWRLDLDLRLAGLPAFRSACVLRVEGSAADLEDPRGGKSIRLASRRAASHIRKDAHGDGPHRGNGPRAVELGGDGTFHRSSC